MKVANHKSMFFIRLCSHLSLSLWKIGCGSAISKSVKAAFFCLLLHSPFTIFAINIIQYLLITWNFNQ